MTNILLQRVRVRTSTIPRSLQATPSLRVSEHINPPKTTTHSYRHLYSTSAKFHPINFRNAVWKTVNVSAPHDLNGIPRSGLATLTTTTPLLEDIDEIKGMLQEPNIAVDFGKPFAQPLFANNVFDLLEPFHMFGFGRCNGDVNDGLELLAKIKNDNLLYNLIKDSMTTSPPPQKPQTQTSFQ
ncbi:hypothetical protein HDU76_008797 [Blyttiomyces sp. JEL0837]|nr:hypothetical protein HDU76_008797 [Blyttiomyces sp. JEL0837]